MTFFKKIKQILIKSKLTRAIFFWFDRHFFSMTTRISPTLNSKLRFYFAFGRPLNLKNPQSFNEKLQWLKLNNYQHNPLAWQCADKLKVREYVKSIGEGDILTKLIAVYDKASDIDWNALPDSFAIKTNHGCGSNIICPDKSKLDKEEARRKLDAWMRKDFHLRYSEMQYKHIDRKIVCEEYIRDENYPLPRDYKFYCFNGKAKAVMVCLDRFLGKTKYYLLDREWNLLRINPAGAKAPEGFSIEKPKDMDRMFDLADKLSKPFPFVRVDLYNAGEKIYFGEMTLTPCGCLDSNYLSAGEKLFGEMLTLKAEGKS